MAEFLAAHTVISNTPSKAQALRQGEPVMASVGQKELVVNGEAWMINKGEDHGTVAKVAITESRTGERTYVPQTTVSYITGGDTVVFYSDVKVPQEIIDMILG